MYSVVVVVVSQIGVELLVLLAGQFVIVGAQLVIVIVDVWKTL